VEVSPRVKEDEAEIREDGGENREDEEGIIEDAEGNREAVGMEDGDMEVHMEGHLEVHMEVHLEVLMEDHMEEGDSQDEEGRAFEVGESSEVPFGAEVFIKIEFLFLQCDIRAATNIKIMLIPTCISDDQGLRGLFIDNLRIWNCFMFYYYDYYHLFTAEN
jgi:hypothetical protein